MGPATAAAFPSRRRFVRRPALRSIPSTAEPATPTITLRTDLFMLPRPPRFADWSHVLDVDKNFIVGKLHVQLNCCWSRFTNGLHHIDSFIRHPRTTRQRTRHDPHLLR